MVFTNQIAAFPDIDIISWSAPLKEIFSQQKLRNKPIFLSPSWKKIRAVRLERSLLDRRNPFELYEDTALWLMNMLEGNLRRKGMIHCL